MKGPTGGRDFSHSKYAKMTGPADGVEQAYCRVEQTRWRIELIRWRSELTHCRIELTSWRSLSRRIELTRWPSWADSLQNWTRSIKNNLNKFAAELSKRTEFDEQRHRVELDVSKTIEYDITRKIWVRRYMESLSSTLHGKWNSSDVWPRHVSLARKHVN